MNDSDFVSRPVFQREQQRRIDADARNVTKDKICAARTPESLALIVNQEFTRIEMQESFPSINHSALLRLLKTPFELKSSPAPLQVLGALGNYEQIVNGIIPPGTLAEIALQSGQTENSDYYTGASVIPDLNASEIAIPIKYTDLDTEGVIALSSNQGSFSDEQALALTTHINQFRYQLGSKFREFRANYDRLCNNLFDRDHGKELLRRAIKRNNGKPVTVAFLDWDNMKDLNDNQSHAKGDNALYAFSLLLEDSLTKCFAYRYGGDEFTLVFDEQSDDEVRATLETIRERSRNLPTDAYVQSLIPSALVPTVGVQMSIGIARGTHVGEVIGKADLAMYKAKDAGRDRIAHYDS